MLILVMDGWGFLGEMALRRISLDFADDQSTLVQVMAWCHQATVLHSITNQQLQHRVSRCSGWLDGKLQRSRQSIRMFRNITISRILASSCVSYKLTANELKYAFINFHQFPYNCMIKDNKVILKFRLSQISLPIFYQRLFSVQHNHDYGCQTVVTIRMFTNYCVKIGWQQSLTSNTDGVEAISVWF